MPFGGHSERQQIAAIKSGKINLRKEPSDKNYYIYIYIYNIYIYTHNIVIVWLCFLFEQKTITKTAEGALGDAMTCRGGGGNMCAIITLNIKAIIVINRIAIISINIIAIMSINIIAIMSINIIAIIAINIIAIIGY